MESKATEAQILYKATERTEWDTAKHSAPLQKDKGTRGMRRIN